jgi:UDP-N-acetyl-D-galactosamine dehydrogenase
MQNECNINIAVVGLGYVGLPLAISLSKKYFVIGFDISSRRISELGDNFDITGEIGRDQFIGDIKFTNEPSDIKAATVYVVTVPTPIDEFKRPDFSPLIQASRMISEVLKTGDLVIYESTVYPGATREICVPELERGSGLKLNKEFGVGYSPERINPGDKKRSIEDIVKITSGSNEYYSNFTTEIYDRIISAGTHQVSSIETAEAAKIIENTQRDVNIALMNEFALICNLLNLDTIEILEASRTKWNFLPFVPGLVGGHCISVDPYYLAERAKNIGHHPELILAGRSINDSIPKFICDEILKTVFKQKLYSLGNRLLVLGATFKENCPDTRNSKSIELINQLEMLGFEVHVYEPNVELLREFYYDNFSSIPDGNFIGALVTVPHDQFMAISAVDIRKKLTCDGFIFDIKGIYPKEEVDWRL